ncbi:MAG: TrkA family potassium uptake protein [Acidobacteriota bacterium]|jgi:trk system potassium uptake protein TrkA|nr:TrkA family potassium uptake protein [Acidobacteriota bacterium]OQB56916.1 MAG: Ktr system potassium uptake protein A [Candidatus Aminicenantes bacterium ADurb.Bin147]HNQ81039.1 TrkA family potassium uptake protein [Candidatus Aminicenantes bacterium]MDD8028842.1 TrkA family potassium uptake protein [Acidobacteriota bacterium]MDD8034212.1 TrkA family potassium uptake protein [Acidobacteriota bacterium]
MKRCVVIGLGIFGQNIVREISDKGFEVIAVDKNKEAVQRVRDLAGKAIVADGTDKDLMDQIGIHEDDTVIISFGDDLAAATLITLYLKQLKVKSIIVKAPNEEHQIILEKVGATEVILPEKEIAHKVARSLISPNVFDYLPLSEDCMIFEMAPPESFLGKTIAELQLRSLYNVMVIAVKDVLTDQVTTLPPAHFVIKDGQVLVLVGKEADIEKLR